jgi:hypothetical protein
MNAFESLTQAPAVDINLGPFYQGDQYTVNRLLPEVGHRYALRDGREFLFVRVKPINGNIARGAPVCVSLQDNAAYNVKFAVTANVAAGNDKVRLTTTGVNFVGSGNGIVPEGFFNGGKIVIPSGNAAGVYGIKHSSAGTGSVGVLFTLTRVLPANITTSDSLFVTQFEFAQAQAYTAASPVVLGFAVHPFTATANSRFEYGYIQTKGVGAVKIKTKTSIAIGSGLSLGDADGLILEAAHATQPIAQSLVAAAQITDADIVPALIL